MASAGASGLLTVASIRPALGRLARPWRMGQLPSSLCPPHGPSLHRGQFRLGAPGSAGPPFQVLGRDLARLDGAQEPLYICRVSVFDVVNVIFDILLL